MRMKAVSGMSMKWSETARAEGHHECNEWETACAASDFISFHEVNWMKYTERRERTSSLNQIAESFHRRKWRAIDFIERSEWHHVFHISFMISFHAFSFTSVNAVRTNEWRYYNTRCFHYVRFHFIALTQQWKEWRTNEARTIRKLIQFNETLQFNLLVDWMVWFHEFH